jgi:hypothetical protein
LAGERRARKRSVMMNAGDTGVALVAKRERGQPQTFSAQGLAPMAAAICAHPPCGGL